MAEEIWRASSDGRAAGLLALLEIDAARFDQALVWNDRACAADPGDPRYALQGARIAALKGDHAGSFDRFAAVLREAPRTKGAWPEFTAAAKVPCAPRWPSWRSGAA